MTDKDKPGDSGITDGQLEELIAYLDGELAPEEAARVERRLSTDPAYRNEMHNLNKTWDMLDNLQRTSVGDNFSRKTIEMITATVAADNLATGKTRLPWKVIGVVLFVLGLAVSGSLGYALGLQIIISTKTVEKDPEEVAASRPGVPSIDGDKKDQQKDFMDWVHSLPTDEKRELLALLIDDQQDTFDDLREEKEFQRLASVQLSSKDIQEIFDWLDEFAELHENEMLAMLPELTEDNLRGIPDLRQRLHAIMITVFSRYQALPPPDPQDIADLDDRLSDEAREILSLLPDRSAREEVINQWMTAALQAQHPEESFQ